MNPPARGLLGLLAAAALVRAADTPLEEWKFDEPAGTALIEISGGQGAAWTENFEATATDGAGLLVARKPSGTAKNSYTPVSTTGGGKIWLVADLAGWGISGSEGRQGFILGFTSTKHADSPVVVAQIVLDREPSGEFVLRGSALGDGATRIDGGKSFGLRRDEPLTLVLEVDPAAGTYSVSYRDGADFTTLGEGQISPGRPIRFVRLSLPGSYAGSGNHFSLDRIAVTESDPRGGG